MKKLVAKNIRSFRKNIQNLRFKCLSKTQEKPYWWSIFLNSFSPADILKIFNSCEIFPSYFCNVLWLTKTAHWGTYFLLRKRVGEIKLSFDLQWSISFKSHWVKSVQILSFFWSVFFGIRNEYGKIRTTKYSVYGHSLHSEQLEISS